MLVLAQPFDRRLHLTLLLLLCMVDFPLAVHLTHVSLADIVQSGNGNDLHGLGRARGTTSILPMQSSPCWYFQQGGFADSHVLTNVA